MGKSGPVKQEPALKAIDTFRNARSSAQPRTRLEAVRTQARKFHEELRSGGTAVFYKTCELVRVPYPVRYGFANVYTQTPILSPVLHIVNRLFVVQFRTEGGVKTMLFSPSDVEANAETRFFKRLGGGELAKMEGKTGEFSAKGLLKTAVQKLVAPVSPTVPEWLKQLGIPPEKIDYISYDHLHTQDLRNWLGTDGKPGIFPNAKLLIMREEWEAVQGLLPGQSDWYCPNGTKGIDPSKVVLLETDVKLGEGVALIRTPGHTMGNHSLVVNTPEGVWVSSENGIGVDAYEPQNSKIDAVRNYAKKVGLEVILNGNTQESSVEQYISMVQEKEIAGRSRRNPDFPNVMPSSEFNAWWLFRGLEPTMTVGDLEFGKYQP